MALRAPDIAQRQKNHRIQLRKQCRVPNRRIDYTANRIVKAETRVVVVGGGIVGAAVLYHLCKLGWTNVVLLERKQLTAGSTWHAAAGFHSMNGSLNMARLQAYTIATYKEIEEISGQDVGLHITGSVTCAATADRWEFLKSLWATNQTLGIESHLLTPQEIKERTCLIETSELLGGLFDPNDGYLDPYGATHAYAKAAKLAGAKVYVNTEVTSLTQNSDQSWNAVTNKGTIKTQHVINAAGLWARELGQMVGVDLPLMPYEHHYIVTESIPQLVRQERESAVTIDLNGGIYVRQEQSGVLYGVYEPGAKAWSVDGTPPEYGESELLPDRLDDLLETLEKGFERFPLVAHAGMKTVVNGPFTFTPDGNPLIGPVRGVKNYWVACGCMAGFSQCGGMALALAQWMIDGEPEEDVFAMDVARFGAFATQAYTLETSRQFYEWRFRVPFPNEAWPAGRPLKTSPIYDRQRDANAVFAGIYGFEVPMWYAKTPKEAKDEPSFERNNSFDRVGEECLAAANSVGIMDASSFSKYEITGPGAKAWLDRLLATRIPEPGRARLAVMLSHKGFVRGDLTLMCLAEGRYMLTGSGPLQEWHMRWFEEFLPAEGVDVRNVTDDLLCLGLIGPRSREVLASLTRTDVSNEAFRFLSVKQMNVGLAPTTVARLSLSGELGYEIYMPALYQRAVYDHLMVAGEQFQIRNIGVRALLSMRLEKSFGIWGREFSPDYTPTMNEMSRFIHYDKPSYVGKDAAMKARDETPVRRLILLEVDAGKSDVSGFEPIWVGNNLVGYVTSGGYGYRIQKSLALAYVKSDQIDDAAAYEILIMGEKRNATLLNEVPYDPAGEKLRA